MYCWLWPVSRWSSCPSTCLSCSVLGVEKGRLIFMLLICGGTFGGMYFKDKLITLSDQIDSVTMPILFIAVFTVIIVCASILISIQLYKSKQK